MPEHHSITKVLVDISLRLGVAVNALFAGAALGSLH